MGILRKKNSLLNNSDSDSVGKPRRFFRKREGRRASKKSRKIKKWILIILFLAILGVGAFYGIRAYNSIRNIFAGNQNILNLLGGMQGELLRGEIDGRVNVLLLGVGDEDHAGANLSDTIILASYDVKSKSVAMISIPRDLYVRLPGGGFGKINSVHAIGEQKKEGNGPEYAIKAVEDVTGVPVHYYARIDFTGMKDIVDSMGGVEVDVERSFCDYEYEGRSWRNPVCFRAGVQNMNGETALMFARSRKAAGPEGSDFARSIRQQKILMAIKDKALSRETALNPGRALATLEATGKHLKTNLGMAEVARVYEISREINTETVVSKKLDPESGLVVPSNSFQSGYILIPSLGRGNFSQIHKFVENIFLTIGIKKEAPKIALLNGTWSTGIFNGLDDGLKSSGFEVVSQGPATNRNHTTTQIIDFTEGKKPESIKYLEEKFGVLSKKSEKTQNQVYEIRVILGSDFRG